MHAHKRRHTKTHAHAHTIFYMEHKLSLGLIAALASARSWSFVTCFYLILFFYYSAKHIHLGCVTVDLYHSSNSTKVSEVKLH